MTLDDAQKLIEREVMDQEEFEDYITRNRAIRTFEGVRKFKSVGRAMRRSNMLDDGTIVPNKPFNNRANTSKRKGKHSRSTNELKKEIYGRIKNI